MTSKVLDTDYINRLLNPPKKVKTQVVEQIVAFDDYGEPRGFDILKVSQPGYEQKGDRGDIWAQWIKQHRTGAADLIARWG